MNRGRLLIVLALVIILGAVIVVAVLPSLNPAPAAPPSSFANGEQVIVQQPVGPTPTPMQFVEIVIAVQDLPRGFRIPVEGAVALRPWPEVSTPVNAIFNLEDVIGKIPRTRIAREQPILTTMITDDFQSLDEVGSDAAAILPRGLIAISLPIDRRTSVAYAIQPGDRVDVLFSMLFVDVDDAFQTIAPNNITLFQITEEGITFTNTIQGRPDNTPLGPAIIGPSERQRPRLVTQRTIQNALVLHVGEFPLDGRLFLGAEPTPTPVPQQQDGAGGQGAPVPTPTPSFPDIVTLGVTPQDAVVLAWTMEARLPVTLALRSAADTAVVNTQAVNMDYIIETFRIDPPGKRSYTIEPAIRSIRQLVNTEGLLLSFFDQSQ
ncbi:MAG: Flp pilus assembly protein CpaB [Aggregatilineales bacterium]